RRAGERAAGGGRGLAPGALESDQGGRHGAPGATVRDERERGAGGGDARRGRGGGLRGRDGGGGGGGGGGPGGGPRAAPGDAGADVRPALRALRGPLPADQRPVGGAGGAGSVVSSRSSVGGLVTRRRLWATIPRRRRPSPTSSFAARARALSWLGAPARRAS